MSVESELRMTRPLTADARAGALASYHCLNDDQMKSLHAACAAMSIRSGNDCILTNCPNPTPSGILLLVPLGIVMGISLVCTRIKSEINSLLYQDFLYEIVAA